MISNEQLLDCIERDAIKAILGTKVVPEALEKLNKADSREQQELKKALVRESVKRKLRILKGEMGEEGTRRKYATDFLSVLLGEKGVDEKNLDKIAGKLKLSEAAYFLTYFQNSTKKTLLYKIISKKSKEAKEEVQRVDKEYLLSSFKLLQEKNPTFKDHELSLSEFGAPIIRKLKNWPAPHITFFEDSESVFFDFWTIGEEKIFFDAMEGDYKKIYPRQQVICRLRLDEGAMEVQKINSTDENVERVLIYIRKLLNNEGIHFEKIDEISEEKFRKIEPYLKKSHEKHEGDETSSSLTRTHAEGDTRNDKEVHKLINKRPFSVLHGTTDNSIHVGYPVMVSLNKSGYFIIKTKTATPSERKKIVNWLWGLLK